MLHYQGQSWPLNLPAAGEHMLYNALAATAVGLALGLAPAETAAALADFRPIHRRSQVVLLPTGVHLLNDCYNANPGSMAMALKTLVELQGSRPHLLRRWGTCWSWVRWRPGNTGRSAGWRPS